MTDPTPPRAEPPIEPIVEAKARVTAFSARPWLLPTLTGIAGFVTGAIVIGAGGAISDSMQQASQQDADSAAEAGLVKILPDALDACGLTDDSNTEIGDEGYSLTVNNKGNDDFTGIDYDDLMCLIDELETPTAVKSHMEQTTSMDGRQTEDWDQITASWSYHPDRGMDAVFEVAKP